jgi:hypothetical protein
LNQRQEPINQKYKGNEGMNGHKPMKTNEKKQWTKNKEKTLCK